MNEEKMNIACYVVFPRMSFRGDMKQLLKTFYAFISPLCYKYYELDNW